MRTATVILSFLLLAPAMAPAQCLPDTNFSEPGIYPDSLPAATGCQPYDQVVTFVLPRDTSVSFAGNTITVPFLYFEIVDVAGLPPGMTWECNLAPGCRYVVSRDSANVDTLGCIRLSGTPAVPASYSLTVQLNASVLLFGQPTISQATYSVPLEVTPCVFAGSCYTLAISDNCAPAMLSISNQIPSNGSPGFSYQWQVQGPGLNYSTADENPFDQMLSQPGVYTVSYGLTIDTIGYILNGVDITSVNCADIGSGGDLYWILKDPAGNTLVNTSSSPVNNGGSSLPLSTGIGNIALSNGQYEFQVWDEDAVLSDQGCATGSMGSGASVFFSVPPAATGPLSVTAGGLSVTFTIDKPVQQIACADTFAIDALPPVPVIRAQGDSLPADSLEICNGGSVLLQAGAADSLEWYRNGQRIAGAGDSSLSVSQTGLYEVVVVNAQTFCQRGSAPVLVSVQTVLPPSIAYDGSMRLSVAAPNPAYRYEWFDLDSGFVGQGAMFEPERSGNFYAQAVDTASGCRSASSPVIRAILAGLGPETGIARLALYPNPSRGSLFLNWDMVSAEAVSVRICDLSGRTLLRGEGGKQPSGEMHFDLSGLPQGLYLLIFETPQGAAVRKLSRL